MLRRSTMLKLTAVVALMCVVVCKDLPVETDEATIGGEKEEKNITFAVEKEEKMATLKSVEKADPLKIEEITKDKSYVWRSDLVIYDLNQGHCEEIYERPTRNCRWSAGLYPFVDWLLKRGRIVAYQIQWFNGGWSEWFVPGVNDIDIKFNPSCRPCSLYTPANTMRRWWSYFYDHYHKYIICYNR